MEEKLSESLLSIGASDTLTYSGEVEGGEGSFAELEEGGGGLEEREVEVKRERMKDVFLFLDMSSPAEATFSLPGETEVECFREDLECLGLTSALCLCFCSASPLTVSGSLSDELR